MLSLFFLQVIWFVVTPIHYMAFAKCMKCVSTVCFLPVQSQKLYNHRKKRLKDIFWAIKHNENQSVLKSISFNI